MPNTALNRTTQVLLTNKSGGSVAYGAVVIVDTTTDSSFTTTTTVGISTTQIGVVLEPNGIANNALGMVAVGGWAPRATLNTAATRGQFIKSHSVAGQGTPHSAPQVEGDFAVALEASATPAIALFGSPNPPAAAGTTSSAVINGRLTTETAVPVSTSNRTAQSTIYFTPYNGNQIGLYTGAAWVLLTYSEKSLALSGLTSGKNYDVFMDYNSGTPQLVLSAAWASDTARTDAIALQDGVYVKSGTTTYRLLGTIRTTGTTTTEDSTTNRFVWNLYNRVSRALLNATETTDSWVYSTATYRQANANSANQLQFVVGVLDMTFSARAVSCFSNTVSGTVMASGIGVNSTSVNSATSYGSGSNSVTVIAAASVYEGYPRLGYNFIPWLEYASSATGTFYGDAGVPAALQSGIAGTVWN